MDSQAASYLAQMPTEVLLRITYFLPTPDLSSVRLTCKMIEESLFVFFTHEFFRKKQFMLSGPSLQALIGISAHQTLSPYLRHVIIATDHYANPYAGFGPSEKSERLHYRLGLADQLSLTNTGHDRAMLAQAFRNLSNLETVDIRDFNGRLRTRDGLNAAWTSYGAPTGRRATRGRMTMVHHARKDYLTHIFTTVLTALADAGARPPNLEVVARDRQWGVYDVAFCIPPWLKPSLTPVLHSLKKLHLVLDFHKLANGEASEMGPFFLQDFLSYTPNLTWLRLNFNNSPYRFVNRLLSWLAKPVPDEASPEDPLEDPDSVSLPALEKLDLGGLQINAETLVGLIAKFTTLRGLSLVRTILVDPRFTIQHKVNLWAMFFKWLAEKGKLHDLYLRETQQMRPGTADLSSVFPDPVFFRDGPGPARGRVMQYSGNYMADFLEKKAKEIEVIWPRVQTDDSSDHDDEDGM